MMNSTLAHRTRTRYTLAFAGLLALLGAVWRVWCVYVAATPERRNQAMVRAVGAGDIVSVRQYLAEGADPNTVFRYLDEPMESQGYSPHAIWLRIWGGPGAPIMRNGPTALMRAVEADNAQMVRLLLEHGADVNKRGWYGNTALSEAEEHKAVQIIRLLKQAGAKQ